MGKASKLQSDRFLVFICLVKYPVTDVSWKRLKFSDGEQFFQCDFAMRELKDSQNILGSKSVPTHRQLWVKASMHFKYFICNSKRICFILIMYLDPVRSLFNITFDSSQHYHNLITHLGFQFLCRYLIKYSAIWGHNPDITIGKRQPNILEA